MKLSRIVVDRPLKDARLAVGITSLLFAFAYALPSYLEGNGQISDVLFGGVLGLAVVTVGFAATSRTRPMPHPEPRQRLRRGAGAAGIGVGLGLLNLGANRALASLDPRIYDLLIERFDRISPWGATLATPLVEEVVFRLTVLSAFAWIASFVVRNPRGQFITALWVSSFVFGLLHISRPVVGVWPLDQIYLAGVALKSTVLGVALGWVFWRWGLPHAILGHALTNGTHWLCEQLLF
ncbi:MAG TPA: CPBP family intramembrane glutamic endopeptidase [Pirellulaceae bacterium]|nr:CPBP family intramembrane glutamic endopeptidase [Pirellulaceae bacterium]